jgi:putative MATE family efflux protein
MSRTALAPVDLGGPDLTRIILRVALPSVIGLSMNALHHLVDAVYIGALGPEAVAAVSSAFPLIILLVAVAEGIGVGTASYIARMLGAGKPDRASAAASLALLLILPLCLVIMVGLLLTLDDVLRLIGVTETALPLAMAYARILIAGCTLLFAQILCDFIAISEGNTRFSMWTLIGSFGLNMLLDPLFIFVLDMGVGGAALATVCAQAAAVTAYAVYFALKAGKLRLRLRALAPRGEILRQIVTVGASATLSTMLGAFAFILIYRTAGAYGDGAVAGIGIALRLLSGGSLPVAGFCLGAQAVLGFSWGAGDHKRLLRALRIMLTATTAFAVLYAGVMIAFAPAIVSLFTEDAGVAAMAAAAVRAFHSFFALSGLYMVTVVLLQASGKARLAAALVLAPQGYLLIPGLLLLPGLWGLDGLLASQPLAVGLSCALALVILLWQTVALRRRPAGLLPQST